MKFSLVLLITLLALPASGRASQSGTELSINATALCRRVTQVIRQEVPPLLRALENPDSCAEVISRTRDLMDMDDVSIFCIEPSFAAPLKTLRNFFLRLGGACNLTEEDIKRLPGTVYN